MSLRFKCILVSLAAVIVTAGACLLVQRSILRQQGIELTRDSMRGILLSAENVRRSVSTMRKLGVFASAESLKAGVRQDDYRNSRLYQTVPVVSAWRAIEEVAGKEGYRFRIAANQPRNPKNGPQGDEYGIIEGFEKRGEHEYFAVSEAGNEIIYARPVVLSEDCLACHGDPGSSVTRDGRDILGMPMENWRNGQVHGAFVLRASLDRLTPMMQAGVSRTLLWILPLSLLVGGVVFLIMSKISKRVDEVAIKLTHSSESVLEASAQIANASQVLAEAASKQAASLEQTSAASHEIKTMAAENAGHSGKASTVVAQVTGNVEAGSEKMSQMITSMNEINAASDKIAQIIKTIDEIAFQTNILALNAAVEAARAGEAGMGFAVVADEVRALAQRCASASRETAVLIDDSIRKARGGADVANSVARVFGSVATQSNEVKHLIGEVTAATGEQLRGIDHIADSLVQMEQVTQGTAASAEESAAAAAEMSTQAQNLQLIIAELQILVNGGSVSA